jgi:hypothetical protein
MADGGPITILFTDVQGSTQLRARHGDLVADAMLADHEAIVRRAIGGNGGAEVTFLGDGFLAAFDTPAAGLRCAIAIQQDLQRYGRTRRPPHPGPDRAAPRRGRPARPHPLRSGRQRRLPGSYPRRPAARSWSPRPCGTGSRRPGRSHSWTAGSTGCAGSPTAGGCSRPSGDATTPAARSGRSRPVRGARAGAGRPAPGGRGRTARARLVRARLRRGRGRQDSPSRRSAVTHPAPTGKEPP